MENFFLLEESHVILNSKEEEELTRTRSLHAVLLHTLSVRSLCARLCGFYYTLIRHNTHIPRFCLQCYLERSQTTFTQKKSKNNLL